MTQNPQPPAASVEPPADHVTLRDIRLYHATGGHVKNTSDMGMKPINGAYILEVHGADRAGIFAKRYVFPSAPTRAQVLKKLETVEEW